MHLEETRWLNRWRPCWSFPEQRRGAWCCPLCIQAAFQAGDKIQERQAAGFILCSIWRRINQHQVCFLKYAPTDTSSFLSVCLIPESSLFLCLLIFVCFPPSPPFSSPSSLSLSLLLEQSLTSFYLILSSPSLLLLFFIPSGRATVLSGICWIWWA